MHLRPQGPDDAVTRVLGQPTVRGHPGLFEPPRVEQHADPRGLESQELRLERAGPRVVDLGARPVPVHPVQLCALEVQRRVRRLARIRRVSASSCSWMPSCAGAIAADRNRTMAQETVRVERRRTTAATHGNPDGADRGLGRETAALRIDPTRLSRRPCNRALRAPRGRRGRGSRRRPRRGTCGAR